MSAEFFHLFVQCETWRLSRDFKEHTAGFTEINRMKIRAIDYRCDVVAKIDETLAPLKLFSFILASKRNVMHRTSRDLAHRAVGLTQQVYNSAQCRVISRDKAESISGFINQTIAECFGEKPRRFFVT